MNFRSWRWCHGHYTSERMPLRLVYGLLMRMRDWYFDDFLAILHLLCRTVRHLSTTQSMACIDVSTKNWEINTNCILFSSHPLCTRKHRFIFETTFYIHLTSSQTRNHLPMAMIIRRSLSPRQWRTQQLIQRCRRICCASFQATRRRKQRDYHDCMNWSWALTNLVRRCL